MAFISCKNIYLDFDVNIKNNLSIRKELKNVFVGSRMERQKSKTIVSALKDINIECSNSERIALTGHNGSGKTTLLRLLASVYQPTSGILKKEGSFSNFFSLNYGMDIELTGRENIVQKYALMGYNKDYALKEMEGIIEFSELDEFIDLPIRIYSSGMSMRLAFSIATSIPSDIILMDEWLSVGDINFVDKAQARLTKIIDKAKILIIGTHSESVVSEFCNREIKLEKGMIVSDKSL